jgi:hypothetical protein
MSATIAGPDEEPRCRWCGAAVNLLSALQGASVVAHNFNDPKIVDIEAKHLNTWIRTLAAEKSPRRQS